MNLAWVISRKSNPTLTQSQQKGVSYRKEVRTLSLQAIPTLASLHNSFEGEVFEKSVSILEF